MSNWREWVLIPVEELDALLSFSHPAHKEVFLQTNLITSSRGFRLHKKVVKTTSIKSINPRICGKIMFKKGEGKKGSWLAAEVIHCNGQFCQKSCPVALQLLYNESHVKINFSNRKQTILLGTQPLHQQNFYEFLINCKKMHSHPQTVHCYPARNRLPTFCNMKEGKMFGEMKRKK